MLLLALCFFHFNRLDKNLNIHRTTRPPNMADLLPIPHNAKTAFYARAHHQVVLGNFNIAALIRDDYPLSVAFGRNQLVY